MRAVINNSLEPVARDPLSLVLAGLGISFAPYEYLGGLFLALAGASIASVMNKDQDKRAFWLVMLTAIFVSHLAALAVRDLFENISVQIIMSAAGFGSRYIVQFFLKVFGVFEKRSDDLAEKIVDRVVSDNSKQNTPPDQ